MRTAAGETARTAAGDTGRRAAGDRGQVAVELLGMTPLIVLTLVLMWQCVLTGYAFTLAGNAADEGVRAGTAAAPGGAREAACRAAALEHLSGDWRGGATVTCGGSGFVTADVDLKVPVLFPGSIDFPVTVHGHAGAVEEVKH
ncbi:pilus assembly protein [Streptomyces sp. NPDC026659]|uniref:pilus assembly protein n=1 Tax=Streptomyces sp. NPDC026659 TaxID=3155123 RepID=UPI003403C12A